jgi:pimeloyl-ACP methyl ester carboxylesterase
MSRLTKTILRLLAVSAVLVSPFAMAGDAISANRATTTTATPQVTTWKTVPTQIISADGVDFSYRELGQQNGGTPVVLLAHLAAVLDNWDPRIVDGIAAKHHVIAFDNRGIGASTGEPARTIEQMADDAITFIKAKGFTQVDLFGFSMGGMVAQEIVLKEPQLVRKMVLTGTGPRGGKHISAPWLTFYDMTRGFFTGQDAKQFLFFTRTPTGIEAGKAFLARLKERTENRDKEIAVSAFLDQLSALSAWEAEPPADLSVVTQPVLIANGDNDRMVASENSPDMAKRFPNSQLIIYPDAGHGGIFQFHTEFVTSALEFLGR